MSTDSQTLPPPPVPIFTGAGLDRVAQLRRDPNEVRALLRDPEARALFASDQGVLVSRDGSSLSRRELSESVASGRDGEPVLLGLERGRPLFGCDLEALAPAAVAALLDSGGLVSLREAGVTLPRAEGGLGAYLAALIGWHRHHRYCPNCGARTEVVEAGLSRLCPRCGRSHFPRTDPVVIMVVQHDDQLLLGRRLGWPAGRYSLLAGFVAAGETPEEAVVREVREEADIETDHPRYVAAQPWPFPASLMLGFASVSPGGEPHADDGEMADVRWFARERVLAAVHQEADWSAQAAQPDELLLPSRVSIARSLIEWWLEARAVSGPAA